VKVGAHAVGSHPQAPSVGVVGFEGHIPRGRSYIVARLRALLLAAVLVALALPSVNPGVALAAYYGACGAANNYHATVYRSGINYIRDLTATVAYLRSPHACTGGSATSFVWPLSTQDGSCEQLGWGAVSGGGVSWYYTKYDNNGCVVYSGGTFPTLRVGDSYSFRIYYTSNSLCGLGTSWAYVITDTSNSTSGHECGTFSNLSSYLWSGFETYDSNDQLGAAAVKQTLASIGWSTASGGTYTYITQSAISPCCGTKETYWSVGVTLDPDGHSQPWGYTIYH
jgi:hypothetical protein